MTPAEFQAHERHFCDECRHDGRGSKACPARKIMKGHPDDAACGHMFRKGRCCQFERRPERRAK